MEEERKIILDLCGGTGSWSKPYKEAGYDVRVITLPEHNVLTYEPPKGVYGILAAPPCTEFSIAKGGRPRDFAGAIEVVEACLRIIWKCRIDGKLKFWALENPRGLLRQFIGKPSWAFEQWQFGDNRRKPTDIWGYYNIPKIKVKQMPPDITDWISKIECPPEHEEYISKFSGDAKRAALRAITPPGFAKAFFEANR